jgi:hypothetical protein
MFSSRKTTNASVALAYDPQFDYVTTLLHGDGTNGAQNNTFVDSSSNAFSLTKQGTPTQGSFTPYGTLWSNYFNGSTDYLTLGGQSTFAFGTNDFTIEGWYYFNNVTSEQEIFDFRPSTTQGAYPMVYAWTDSKLYYWVSSANKITSSITLSAGNWYHIAICRSGTSTKMFINGTQSGSTYTDTTNYLVGANRPVFGVNAYQLNIFFNGYISNLRVVNGTAVYTSNFTVPTTPLTAITNTVLLTCQSNRFIDNSTNNYTVTLNGTPSVQRFNPFLPTSSQAYSTSVYGGSAYYNGSTDCLNTSISSAFNFYGNSWTIEGWFYLTAFTSDDRLFVVYVNSSTQFGFYIRSGSIYLGHFGADEVLIGSMSLNNWSHIAFVNSGSTITCYVNGKSTGSTTAYTLYNSNCSIYVGGSDASYALKTTKGYITDARVVNGTAVYTSNFTPPTSPLSAITNTQLLLSMQNAGIYDNAMINDYLTAGSAQISTSVKKYGTGSISFDGSTSYLLSNTPNTSVYTFGTGAFTIEFWVYLNSTSSNPQIISFNPTSTNGAYPLIYIGGSTTFAYYVNNSEVITGSTTPSTGAWYHVAICRSGTSTKLFVNGTQQGSTYTDSNNYQCGTNRPVIGCGGYNLLNKLNGYIDDLRITNGYARYTSNFIPPTQALANYGM